jgi:hypothetical protein
VERESAQPAPEASPRALTVDEVCQAASIAKATARNWIRLGKLGPDIGNQLFSQEYVARLVVELKSGSSTRLKSRRNKKSITGKVLYKDYIHTESSRRLVLDLLELGIIEDRRDLLAVLANFAVQLYYQSSSIQFADNNVLLDFLSQKCTSVFHSLINDLLGGCRIDA